MKLNRQQFAACCFLALLSPMIRILPGAAARMGGGVCWLSAVPACGALLLFLWWMLRFLQKEPRGMAVMLRRCLGRGLGRLMLGLYGLAFLFYIGFILRVGADRLIATVYPKSGPTVFVLVMLLACLTAAMGRMTALGRTAVIFRTMMLAVLALMLGISFKDIDPALLDVPRMDDLPALARGALPMVNVGGFALCFSFLGGYVDKKGPAGRVYLPWLGVLCGLMLLLCVTVVGRFGAYLTGELHHPFFTMVRDLSLLHLADRVEALIVGMWVFSDFVLCTMLLRCSYEAWRECFALPDPEALPYFSLKGGRWLLLAETALAGVFAALIARSSAELLPWSKAIVPLMFAALVFIGFPLVWLIGKLRKRI